MSGVCVLAMVVVQPDKDVNRATMTDKTVGLVVADERQLQRRSSATIASNVGTVTTNRRDCITALTALFVVVATTTAVILPQPAYALKEKNEALCGTGFFENIYQYKCTDIGDIQDEGYAKSMSQSEDSTADSLFSKLQLGSSNSIDEDESTRKSTTASQQPPFDTSTRGDSAVIKSDKKRR